MYFEQFGLHRPPFEETTNPAFYYDARTHRAALTEALDHLRHDAGLILIQGQRGSGKTMLGRVLMQRLQEQARILSLSLPPSGADSVLQQICAGFHLEVPSGSDGEECIARIARSLSTQLPTRCVVFIDRAEHLSAANLLELEQVIKTATDAGFKLGIVLIAQEELEASLRLPEIKALSKRITRTTPLKKLSPAEALEYIAARLRAAGENGGNPFTPEALRRIASLTDGWPRRINELAKRALVRAAQDKTDKIDEELVLTCSEETGDMGTRPTADGPGKAGGESAPQPVPPARHPSQELTVSARDIRQLESLVRRFEDLLASAPARIAEMEDDVRRLEARGNDAQHKLADATGKLANVGRTSEERISLLLTSLDTAQGIHDQLEGVGKEVSTLVKEFHQAALEEHDRLQASFDELDAQREALSGTIDQMRQERQSALQENRQLVNEQLEQMRQAAAAADTRLAQGTARFEGIVATEDNARQAAIETVRSAKSALVKVQESEAKLAEAQESAINIEAATAAALASIQKEVKRIDESVGVVVNHGVRKVQSAITGVLEESTQQAHELSRALKNEAAIATKHVENAVRSASAVTDEQIAKARESARLAGVEVVDYITAARSTAVADLQAHLETAGQEIEEKNETIRLAGAEVVQRVNVTLQAATENIQKQVQSADKQIEAATEAARCAGTQAVNRMNEARAQGAVRLEEELQEVAAHVETLVADAVGQISTEAQKNTAATTEFIAAVGRAEASRVEEAADTAVSKAEDRISVAASSVAGAIQDQFNATTEATTALKEAVATGGRTVAEVNTAREQINHLIRDVWALTTTTDQRAGSLAALAEAAQTTEANIQTLVDKAEAQSAALATQAAIAAKSAATLGKQHQQVKEVCHAFTEKIAQAKQVNEQLSGGNESGSKIQADLASQTSRLEQLLESADAIVETIRAEDERIHETSRSIEQLTTAADALEPRLAELQEALANPMTVIQDARAQAEEMNEVCLAVKRVFRSVSQASLEANQRIKTLGKLLAATERSGQTIGQTMRQWIEEAVRAQDRLASTLRQVPPVGTTHPPLAFPDVGRGPFPTGLKGAQINAVDRATMQQTAHAGAARPKRPSTALPTAQETGTTPAGTSGVAKKVEPLVDVLKACQARKAQDTAALERTNQASVIPGQVQANSASGAANRLRPEEVRAMIEEAKEKAAART